MSVSDTSVVNVNGTVLVLTERLDFVVEESIGVSEE
jgi:hypothetical protein